MQGRAGDLELMQTEVGRIGRVDVQAEGGRAGSRDARLIGACGAIEAGRLDLVNGGVDAIDACGTTDDDERSVGGVDGVQICALGFQCHYFVTPTLEPAGPAMMARARAECLTVLPKFHGESVAI